MNSFLFYALIALQYSKKEKQRIYEIKKKILKGWSVFGGYKGLMRIFSDKSPYFLKIFGFKKQLVLK